jgi:hypothetical protein
MTLPNIDFVKKENYLIKKSPLKFELPFVKVNLGRKNESTHIIRRMNNSKRVVKKHLDTLLLTGFEGTYDDLNKVYLRNENLRKRKNRQKKRYNSSVLLRSDLLSNSIHLTKVKEFNFMNNKKDNKNMNIKTVLNIYKIKNKDNNEVKKENNKNNENNINEENISDISEVINHKNQNLSIIKDKINKKKKLKFIGMKKIKSIRKLLTKQSNNLLKDNDNGNLLKTYNEKNKENNDEEKTSMKNTRLDFAKRLIERCDKKKHKYNYNNSADDINDIFDKYLKKRDDTKELKRIFGPLADGFREGLKEVKRDIGQYIWIKRSTANLISFGNSFKLMADDVFYKEHKRIIEKYPSLERDAKIILPKKKVIENKEIINKLENNERTIKNIFNESEKIVKGVHLKLSKFSKKYSNSQPSIMHKKKKFGQRQIYL